MSWQNDGACVEEPSKKIKIIGSFDVIVVGAGPAGIPAAIAAARNGADTLLIERSGWLGGYFAEQPGSGSGLCFHDAEGNQIIAGIGEELIDRLIERNGALPPIQTKTISSVDPGWPPKFKYMKDRPIVDVEELQTLCHYMLEEAGVTLLLHSWVTQVAMNNNAVKGVIFESKSGRQAILGKVIVDASGDADVAAFAGVPFEKTDPEQMYQVQRAFRVANVDSERIRREIKRNKDKYNTFTYLPNEFDLPPGWQRPLSASKVDVRRYKVSDDGMRCVIIKGNKTTGEEDIPRLSVGLRKDISYVHAAAEADGSDVREITRAEVEIRKELDQQVQWLRDNIPGFEDCYVIGTGESPHLGIRGTRRIIGEYIITEEDIIEGRKFPDTIGRSANSIDLHWPDELVELRAVKGWHDIPYRCLVPQKIDNLLMAGKCCSCTHIAQGAMRKVPNCMVMGQAAGTAAAIAAERGQAPRTSEISDLQETLKSQKVIL